jgi:P-type conjugative transfer protein TrbL
MRFFLKIETLIIAVVVAAAVIVGLQSSALAQSALTIGSSRDGGQVKSMKVVDKGMLDRIGNRYVSVAKDNWSYKLKGLARSLFMWLVLVSGCWTMISMAMKNEDFSSIVFELCRFFIFHGFFFWLLNGAEDLGGRLAASLLEVANRATGYQVSGPDDVVNIGLNFFKRCVKNFSFLSLKDSIALILVGLLFLICSAVMAVNFLILQVMFVLVAICGVFFLGFGGCRWTSDVALSYYRTCLSAGAQLMGMVFVVSLGYNILNDEFMGVGHKFDLGLAAEMFVVGIVFFMLSLKFPNALAQLISALGSSASDVNRAGRMFHMSKMVGAAAGVAVGAVGGAVMGAKAAAAGAKGATASKGGGEAGKSVADGIGKLAGGGKGQGEPEGKKSVHAEVNKDDGAGQQGRTKQGPAAGRAGRTRAAGGKRAPDMRNAIRSGIRGFEQRIPAGLKGGLKGAGKGALSAARTAMDGNLGGVGAFHKTLTAGLNAVPRKSATTAEDQQAAGRPPEALDDAAASAGPGDANPAARSHTPSLAEAQGHDADGASAQSTGQREGGRAAEAPAAPDAGDQASPDQSRRESLHDQHVQDWMTDDGQPLLAGAAHGRHIASGSAAPKGDARSAEQEASSVPYQRLVNQPSPEPSARAVPPANGNGASRQAPLHASSGTSSVANHGGAGNGPRGAGQAASAKQDVPYVRLPEAPPVQSARRGSGTSQQGLLHAGGGTPSSSAGYTSTGGGTLGTARTAGSSAHAPRSEASPAQSGVRSGDISQQALARGGDGAQTLSSRGTGSSDFTPSTPTVSAVGHLSHVPPTETPWVHSGVRSGDINQQVLADGNAGGTQGASTVSASGNPTHAPRFETPPAQSGGHGDDAGQRALVHTKSNASEGADSGIGSPVSPVTPISPVSPADELRDVQGLIQDDAVLQAAAEPPPDASLDEVSARGFWVERRTASSTGEAPQDKQDQAPS